jgi:hypothetical protein
MKRKNIEYISLFVMGILVLFLSLNFTYTKVYAEDLCPGIPDDSQECLEYLQNEYDQLQGEKSNLQKRLEAEEYQQLSLGEKINYLSKQISQSEKLIASKEVEINTQTVEIYLLEKDIQKKEDSIAVMKQEISVLEESVSQRIEESYKYSFIGTLEIFLDGGDFGSILRKTKYLIETREKDKIALVEMNDRVGELRAEELALADEKKSLEEKRYQLEEDRTQLVTDKKELDVQKAEYNKLLTESKLKSAEYEAKINSLTKAAAEIDNAVAKLILQLYNTGKLGDGTHVGRGDVIGIDGHTGCAYGTHLHYVVYKNNVIQNPLNYLTGTYYLSSGFFHVPMSGAVLTQGYRPPNNPSHYAIDMISTNSGNQSGEKYCVHEGELKCDVSFENCSWNPSSWFNLRGEGAPVRASDDGTVFYYTDWYGGKYAVLIHDDEIYKTLYLHLKY